MTPSATTIGPACSDAGPGWLLLAVAAALPWLIAPAGQPWPGFHRDWLQALLWLVAAAVVVWRCREPWALSPSAAALLAVAAVPPLQAAAGLYAEPADALLPALTLAGLALAVALASHSQRAFALHLADALFAGLVIAGLASVTLALLQWLQIDLLGPLSNARPLGGRPTANLGQPNLLATLLLWSLVGAAWGHWRGQIGRATLVLLCAVLLLGIVMTQSRSGALGVVALALFAAFAKCRAAFVLPGKSLAALGFGFVLLVVAWPTINAGLGLEGARTVADTASGGKRPAIWAAMLDAVGRSPWLGYGWDQGIAAHLAVADDRPPLHVIVQHAHNLGLDLLVWNGAVLGTLLALALLVWYGRRLLKATDPPRWLLLAALSVLGLHSLLELPHMLPAFLVPAALMAGTLEALEPGQRRWALPRPLVAVLVFVFAALLVQLAIERQRVLEDLLAHRMIRARIGDLTPPPPPSLFLLRPVQRALADQRIEPRPGMPAAEIEALDRSALRHAAAGALFNAAQAAALNGRPAQAALRLRQLCALHPRPTCDAAREAWAELARTRYPGLAAVPFPAPAAPRQTGRAP